jgi:NADPH-dependent 2,4-dienoyl-CoA reductase/sulfur reductase-like enzyme
MKILIVGGVAGGASAAARLRRLDESARIILFERGPHVSFSNCSLPYHLSGLVPQADDLVLMDSASFRAKYNIEARVSQEVTAINRASRSLTVRDLRSGATYDETYDKLILSPGASPIVPDVAGARSDHVFTIRNVVDIDRLNRFLRPETESPHESKARPREVAVVGGGFIGLEVAENLRQAGFAVTIVEAADQVLAPFDYDMAQIVHKTLLDNGIQLIVGDGLARIGPEAIELKSGRSVPAQAVVLAIGVRPETNLAAAAGLEIGQMGGIRVDAQYRTSDPDIYAVGDAIEVFHRLLHTPTRLALAGPAIRQARAAADHIYGRTPPNKGVIGSSAVRIFDMNFASTGLSVKAAERAGIPVDSVYVMPGDKVSLMPDAHVMHFKLIYEVPTGRLLGAQAAGQGAVDKRIDVLATLITMGGTIEDLKDWNCAMRRPLAPGATWSISPRWSPATTCTAISGK